QATKELRALSAAFADQPQFAIALARAYSDQGQMLGGLGKTDQEEEAYRQCLEVLKQVQAKFEPVPPDWNQTMADVQLNLAYVYAMERRDSAAALVWAKGAAAYQWAALKENPSDLGAKQKTARYALQLAKAQARAGDYAAASQTAAE